MAFGCIATVVGIPSARNQISDQACPHTDHHQQVRHWESATQRHRSGLTKLVLKFGCVEFRRS